MDTATADEWTNRLDSSKNPKGQDIRPGRWEAAKEFAEGKGSQSQASGCDRVNVAEPDEGKALAGLRVVR